MDDRAQFNRFANLQLFKRFLREASEERQALAIDGEDLTEINERIELWRAVLGEQQ